MREWLVEIRKRKKMSQYKVAKAAGISQSYYAAIETGDRGKPLNVTIARKVADVMGFPWQRFYEEV